jgi:hypothetical protein
MTRVSSCTSLAAIKFNLKTITDRGNPLEYFAKKKNALKLNEK